MTPFDPTALSDDDLRLAVAEARRRLDHIETCEHCIENVIADARAALDYRDFIATFNENAAKAGYLIAANRTLVHRWDCPSMQAYLREVDRFTEDPDLTENLARGGGPSMPKIATQAEARAFVDSGKARRGCRTCAPDL